MDENTIADIAAAKELTNSILGITCTDIIMVLLLLIFLNLQLFFGIVHPSYKRGVITKDAIYFIIK
jgi:hypothetical protein